MFSYKRFISEVKEGMTQWPFGDEVGHTQDAKREIKELFPNLNSHSKHLPTNGENSLIKKQSEVNYFRFFAGTASTAHGFKLK
jgi:hypothetical protein